MTFSLKSSMSTSTLHNLLYIKTQQFIHIFDMDIELFNENVIELPLHLASGCMTVYADPINALVEYLIIVTDQDSTFDQNTHPTTWIYRVDQGRHNVTFYDIGPDLVGPRQHHSCAVMDGYLYVIGGVYNDSSFVEEWDIDIVPEMETPLHSEGNSTATEIVEFEDVVSSAASQMSTATMSNTFVAMDTFVERDYLEHSVLPQRGHRSVVDHDHQRIYVIGGMHRNPEHGVSGHHGNDEEDAFIYCEHVLVLERRDDVLYEINYAENEEELESETHAIGAAKLIPTLPRGMAFVAPMIDRYGYLNVFGGEWAPNRTGNWWLRVSTKKWSLNGGTELDDMDPILKYRRRHSHNEQWALLILAVMITCICCWCKSVNRVREKKRISGRTGITDGSAYDEVTENSSDIDELEHDLEYDEHDDDLVPMKDPLSSENEATTDLDADQQNEVLTVPESSDADNGSESVV